MTATGFTPLRELAHRANDGLEVTLFWHSSTGELTVCVCDERRGSYFEIRPEPHQALDVFYHPYVYASDRPRARRRRPLARRDPGRGVGRRHPDRPRAA